MKPILTMTISTIKGFARDKAALFWSLIFPVFFIIIFGLVFSGNGDPDKFPIGLVVEEKTPIAEGLEKAFSSVPVLTVTKGTRDEELAALKKGNRRAVVVIPVGFYASVFALGSGKLEVYYDAAQPVMSQTILSVLREVLGKINEKMTGRQNILEAEEKPLQARSFRYIDYLLPGILAMSLMQLGLFSAGPMVAQREKQILKRLGATPLPRSIVVISQVILRLIIALVQTFLILLVGRLLFNVQVTGNLLAVLFWVVIGALTFIAVGYIVASFVRSEESCDALTQIINFPFMFLSGVFFPLEMMPSFMRPIIKVIPLTYLADALRQVMTGASRLYPLTTDVLVLLGWLVVCMLISFRFFRWE